MKARWTTTMMSGALSLAPLVLLGATSAHADHFKPLSPNHTAYGVSQLGYGDLRGRDDDSLTPMARLHNPNHVTQVAALIFYDAARGRSPGTPEVFVGCHCKVLTPHASVGVSEEDVPDSGRPGRARYAEAIWSPVDPVRVSKGRDDDDDDKDDGDKASRRIADGLGGAFNIGANDFAGASINLAHPGLFSLPSNSVVPGQRQVAIDCLCNELARLNLNRDIFKEFGVTCR